MLDLFTLRAVQAAIAVCVALLFYFGTYRATRSRFASYWVLVIATSAVAAGAYLFRDTAFQWIANPLGNGLSVLTAAFIWAATRGLRRRRIRWWALAVGPLAAVAAALAGDSAEHMWAGGEVLLISAVVYLGLAAREVWLLHAALGADIAAQDGPVARAGERPTVATLGVAATAYALFYAVRLGFFVTVGPDHASFEAWVGSIPTAFSVILTLVVVTFGMTTLDQLDRTRQLQESVRRDELTGLLSRRELMATGPAVVERARAEGARAFVLMADMDHFKDINDRHGHAAGDSALRAFGQVCERLVGNRDIAGRLGGEEFALLVVGATRARAVAVAEALRSEYTAAAASPGVPDATLSIGVTAAAAGEELDASLGRADEALYDAKRAGRDQVVFRES